MNLNYQKEEEAVMGSPLYLFSLFPFSQASFHKDLFC